MLVTALRIALESHTGWNSRVPSASLALRAIQARILVGSLATLEPTLNPSSQALSRHGTDDACSPTRNVRVRASGI